MIPSFSGTHHDKKDCFYTYTTTSERTDIFMQNNNTFFFFLMLPLHVASAIGQRRTFILPPPARYLHAPISPILLPPRTLHLSDFSRETNANVAILKKNKRRTFEFELTKPRKTTLINYPTDCLSRKMASIFSWIYFIFIFFVFSLKIRKEQHTKKKIRQMTERWTKEMSSESHPFPTTAAPAQIKRHFGWVRSAAQQRPRQRNQRKWEKKKQQNN